jgi:hypothetical protein
MKQPIFMKGFRGLISGIKDVRERASRLVARIYQVVDATVWAILLLVLVLTAVV